ncbi:DNA-3-methyladenine glycosylase family protein [Allorhizocola rhizosphaerae]|uniref:DNA-3-methyladenine glycosylase family protein n=1 Tax=Allorhizocola rhizosphaerae TaxID=1872709 RepID=UPI001FEB9FAC|nr:DNA-3-methyladenine glycosylase 2 family protein [Allorhizocola rhizosphaerae]
MTQHPDPDLGFDPKKAIAHLKRADPVLAKFIDRAGPFDMVINPADSVFGMLAEAIVYQQLTGKAAATIFKRVCELYSPNGKRPKPKQILGSTEEQLRGAGLSKAKALALLDLAARADSGELPTLAKIRKMPDEEIIENLVKVRGVGQWTAEMFLIFRLGRPDVLPYDDYGLRRGYTIIYRTKELPGRAELEKAGEKWAPFRTAASWYLWRAAEVAGPGGGPPQPQH